METYIEKLDITVYHTGDSPTPDNIHRDRGPAVIRGEGGKQPSFPGKMWFVDGLRHNLTGPAIEWADGRKEYFINGVSMSKETHEWFMYGRSIPFESGI